jgi:hypothetical protein
MRRYVGVFLAIVVIVACCCSNVRVRPTIPPVTPDAAGFGLAAPRNDQIFQRHDDNTGEIRILGGVPVGATQLRVQVSSEATAWSVADSYDLRGNQVNRAIRVPSGGWYSVTLRAFDGRRWIATPKLRVGVGEVFITAGQSNSLPSGEVTQPSGPDVAFVDMTVPEDYARQPYSPYPDIHTWRDYVDFGDYWHGPNYLGSPWPAFATELSEKLGVPVGLTEVGCAGTRVSQWLPTEYIRDRLPGGRCGNYQGLLYDRLATAASYLDQMGGFRAVLWHQGENDTLNLWNSHAAANGFPQQGGYSPFGIRQSSDYFRTMARIIRHLRADTGHDVHWFVARAAYVPSTDVNLDPVGNCTFNGRPNLNETAGIVDGRSAMASVLLAQDDLIRTVRSVHAGPATDSLAGYPYRYWGFGLGGCIHFSGAGLATVGHLWAESVLSSGLVPLAGRAAANDPPGAQGIAYRNAVAFSNDEAPGAPASAILQGSVAAFYSSNTFATPANDRLTYLGVWLDAAQPVSRIRLAAHDRQAFPLLYDIFLSLPEPSTGRSDWAYAGQYDDAAASDGAVTVRLDHTYMAQGALIVPRLLGAGRRGEHMFQLNGIALLP